MVQDVANVLPHRELQVELVVPVRELDVNVQTQEGGHEVAHDLAIGLEWLVVVDGGLKVVGVVGVVEGDCQVWLRTELGQAGNREVTRRRS